MTLGPGYYYTPSSGNLTIDIQNPVVNGTVTYTGTPVDPETRTLNTSTYLVGATNGSLNVNAMGGSVYSVPLEIFPGVNGLSPGLSLEYSSNRGPGIAGYGWQIGGLSVISRGPQTYYHDGSAKGVNLDNNDRFYLDGQRLVNISTYGYGDFYAQYRTDIDIFTRVTPQAPNWFKAETKSGLIFEYGNNPGSKQLITGSYQIVNWYVSKISDVFGNQMNFAYIQDNFSVYPAEITYGPNTITFYYKERNDKTCTYLKGVKIEQRLLLDKIIIKYNSTAVKTYEFKYTYQGSYYNSYSTLNEIIEYGVGTGRFNSTAITYQIPANVSFAQTTYNTSHLYVNYRSRLIPGDYDGDGKTDFFCLPDAAKGATWTGLKVYFSDGNDNFTSSFSQSTLVPGSGMTLRDIRSLDINGDGRDDILYEEGSSSQSTFKYMISNGNSFASPVVFFTNSTNSSVTGISGKRNRMQFTQGDDNEFTSLKVPSFSHFLTSSQVTRAMKKSEKRVAADYNGDGVNDIFVNFPEGNWIIRSLVNSYGQMTPSMNYIGSGLQPVITKEVLSGDFNGDGKADIWCFEDTGLKIYTLVGTGLDTLYISTWPTRKHFFNLGDFNADGKVDMFLYGAGRDETEYDWSEWQIRLSTGTDFETVYIPKKKNNLKDDLVRLGDFDGDGSTDIMVTAKEISWNGVYFYISKNNGTDLYAHNIAGYPAPNHNYYVSDYDGDNHTDFILTDGQSPWWTGYQVYKTTGKTSVLLEKAGNGLGNLTKLTYTKLSQASSGIYQLGSGAVYPLADFKGPWNVVTSVQYDNGKGSLNTQNYYYEGVKIHLQGKGFLGFTKTRISDVASGIDNESVITSGFNATYFYPNVYLTLRKRSNSTDTLEKTKNTMYRKELDATKKWIFPYIQVSTQTDKLTGHSVTVNSSYDNYGNPTSIVKSYSNGKTEKTLLVYDDSIYIGKWLIGRPATSTTTLHIQGNDTIKRIEWKVFDQSNNNLKSIT